MKIPHSFTRSRCPKNTAAGAILQRDASRVLRRVANDLALRQREYSIRTRRQRRRLVDVFSLHTDALYFEISHAPADQKVQVRYRTCAGRNDHGGGRNNAVSLESLSSPEGYDQLLANLRFVASRRG